MTSKIGTKIVVTRCVFQAQNMPKNAFASGVHPRSRLGILQCFARPLAGFGGRFVAERGEGREERGQEGTGLALETAYSWQLFSPQSAPGWTAWRDASWGSCKTQAVMVKMLSISLAFVADLGCYISLLLAGLMLLRIVALYSIVCRLSLSVHVCELLYVGVN